MDFPFTRIKGGVGAPQGFLTSAVSCGIKNPEDARTINSRARELGFSTSIGIIHDGSGRLKPAPPAGNFSLHRHLWFVPLRRRRRLLAEDRQAEQHGLVGAVPLAGGA